MRNVSKYKLAILVLLQEILFFLFLFARQGKEHRT